MEAAGSSTNVSSSASQGTNGVQNGGSEPLQPSARDIDLTDSRAMETPLHSIVVPPIKDLTGGYQGYFGLTSGGIDLPRVVQDLPLDRMQTLLDALHTARESGGRIFVLGNGGSFDNCRVITHAFDELGFDAKTPGDHDKYLHFAARRIGYERIFVDGLEHDSLNSNDIVLGLSGSGNSPNVVLGFEFALQRGAKVFALGGRDGGAMCRLIPDEHAIITSTQSMEALEDAHYAAALIIASALKAGNESNIGLERDKFADSIRTTMTQQGIEQLAGLAASLVNTMYSESRAFIVSLEGGIGAGHFRADAQRGFTNGIPIRGIRAPETHTTNSGMATANDDGFHYVIADGVVKFGPNENDLGIVFIGEEDHYVMNRVRDIFHTRDVPVVEIGKTASGVNTTAMTGAGIPLDFVASMIGHSTGDVIRAGLEEAWAVAPLEIEIDLSGQRKLGERETFELERRLRHEGTIGEDEVVTFAYGKTFRARCPETVGLKREHY